MFPTPGSAAELARMAEAAEQVAERLIELVRGLGLDHVVVVGHSRNTLPDVFAESSRRFGTEVLPLVRRALG